MDDKTNSGQRHIRRRALLKVVGTSAGVLALGGAGAGTVVQEKAQSSLVAYAASPFIKGADVSWLPQMEANGYTFFNANGVQQDLLTILKGYGINAISLRTWVNPSSDPANGHCSQPETIAMALRCQNAGLPVIIGFHFGDTWNSVGVQNPPAAWASLSYSQMLTVLSNYVSGFMNAMRSSSVTPGWVAIGNEINSGICHPTGSLSNPSQMTGLLNAAYAQVKAVFPSVPVLIHLGQPQNTSVIENFFDTYKSNGGNWDITAFSSYGSGSSIPGIITNMATYQSRYGKPVMQVEFGGPVSNPGQTQASLEAYINGVNGFGGLGVFYWEPEGYSPFTSYAMGAWNSTTRRPTTALNGFLNAPTGTTPPTPTPTSPPTATVTATATATATPTPTGTTTGGVHVTYVVQNQWTGGFTTSLSITNNRTTTINGWTLAFSFSAGQQITQGWSGTFSQSGSLVTITNLSYNGTLAPGQTITLGFNGSWNGSNPNPTAFTLNGSPTS
jgi:arabinogalactan endo-1,4-beta-galactosidase